MKTYTPLLLGLALAAPAHAQFGYGSPMPPPINPLSLALPLVASNPQLALQLAPAALGLGGMALGPSLGNPFAPNPMFGGNPYQQGYQSPFAPRPQRPAAPANPFAWGMPQAAPAAAPAAPAYPFAWGAHAPAPLNEIGRASCRERV